MEFIGLLCCSLLLFVIFGVAEHAGLITVLANLDIGMTGGDPGITFVMVIWMSVLQVPL
jgi:hypothetical protein